MTHAEVLEIKKQFTPKKSALSRLATCYVDHEKNIVFKHRETILAAEEEELFKYLKTLSAIFTGKEGKTLHSKEFPLVNGRDGGMQEQLLELRDSDLSDEKLDEFYEQVIEHFNYPENYLIMIANGHYDAPKKASDGAILEDSEENYSFITCAICPVKLEKPALSIGAKGLISNDRRFMVQSPVTGFLFPAFNDRTEDIHGMLYYAKKELFSDLMTALTGTEAQLNADSQKEAFVNLMENMGGEIIPFDTVQEVYQAIGQKELDNNEPTPALINKEEIKSIFNENGIPTDTFDDAYEQLGLPEEMPAYNLVDITKTKIAAPDVEIKIKPEKADLVEKTIIDGKPCLVINLEGSVSVNDIVTQ